MYFVSKSRWHKKKKVVSATIVLSFSINRKKKKRKIKRERTQKTQKTSLNVPEIYFFKVDPPILKSSLEKTIDVA